MLLSVIAVTTTNQAVDTDADTSLQEAIFAANFDRSLAVDPTNLSGFITTSANPGSGADTIVLQLGATYQVSGIVQDPYNQTGPSANPMIFSTITIEGNGATLERVGSLSIRALAVADLLTNITLPDSTVIPVGTTGNLTLRNLHIKGFQVQGGNGAEGGGGDLGAGGGVYLQLGALTIENCTFESNSATGGNGNVPGSSEGGGGGAGLGGAIYNDGGNATIRNSTFTGNSATGGAAAGGGLAGSAAGGAIYSRNGSLKAYNSTFSGNSAGSEGGAIFVLGDGTIASVIVRDTIIANNGTDEGEVRAVNGGTIVSAGSGNLIMANAPGLAGIPGVVSTADPQLGPLQLNAPGNTPTMAIPLTSPAFNTADNAALMATDQRGVPRPQGALGDIGAFELLVVSLELQPPVPDLVDLDPIDDSGLSDTDDNTFDTAPHIRIQADLADFAAQGYNIIADPTVAANRVNGLAVEMFVNGISVGFAKPIAGTDSTLFEFTLDSTALDDRFAIFPPGSAGAPARGWLNFVTAAVRLFDATLGPDGTPAPQTRRTLLSDPLRLTFDSAAPTASSTPDLLAVSDSGTLNDDDVTNVTAPAFQGTAETNARIRIFANGLLVGQGVVGGDATDGVLGNGLGTWEVTVEPLADGSYSITASAEDLAGNRGPLSNSLSIAIDTQAPDTPYLDLVDTSDSGRSNADNITNDDTPTVTTTADDVNAAGLNLSPHDIRYRIFERMGTGPDILLVNGFPGLTTGNFFTDTLPLLANGLHDLKVEVEDRAGNLSHAFLLQITIDTVAPASPTVVIDPASTDTGVDGYPATIADRVTSDTGSSFLGSAEADSIVRLFADGNPISLGTIDGSDVAEGLTVAVPADGNLAFPSGQWRQAVIRDLNDPDYFPLDGLRQMGATAEDVAGNVSAAGFLNVFLDTQGPQITNLAITGSPVFNLFGIKSGNGQQGPTPPVNSLTISVRDLPNRDTTFFPDHVALLAAVAASPGNFVLVGDAGGIFPIQQILVINDPVVDGQPATATIQLVFAQPLPDDRFTLTIRDGLVDPAGNKLDGESNAAEPNGAPTFPSGDGVPGGAFAARFTVDSRPEIGVTAATRIYLDTNGNFLYDPAGSGDATNRDLIFQFGIVSDAYFAGNFNAAGNAPASGFEKLGAYGWDPMTQKYRFLLDFNHNGVADFMSYANVTQSALPVAGDFAPGHPGDEIGLFTGNAWYLDQNGDNVIDVNFDTPILTGMRGIPVVGDINGDGTDDLITYDAGVDTFYIDLNRDGLVDDTIQFGIPDFVERPVAGDLNLDGVDDLGLWVAGNAQKIGEGKAEWYFLVSDRATTPSNLASPLFDRYSPDPLGNDLFANYGDRYSLPIFGNFDPPVAGGGGATGGHLISYTNANLPLDVNDDGVISPLDALFVINHLNANGSTAVPDVFIEYDGAAPFVDVNADRLVSPSDALNVINYLNRQVGSDGEGEARGAQQVLAADSAESDQAGVPCTFVDLTVHSNRSIPNGSRVAADGITERAGTPVTTLTPPIIGQADSRQTAIADSDEWLGDDMDLEEILELIADKVPSNWWDS